MLEFAECMLAGWHTDKVRGVKTSNESWFIHLSSTSKGKKRYTKKSQNLDSCSIDRKKMSTQRFPALPEYKVSCVRLLYIHSACCTSSPVLGFNQYWSTREPSFFSIKGIFSMFRQNPHRHSGESTEVENETGFYFNCSFFPTVYEGVSNSGCNM